MDLKQYLVIGALLAGLLTGCGSDSNSDSQVSGASYSGITTDADLTESSKEGISSEVVIAVNKLTYTGDVIAVDATPKAMYRRSISLTDSLNDLFFGISDLITDYVGSASISNTPVEGDCGGSAIASGSAVKFSADANAYCVLSGTTKIYWTGGFSFEKSASNYTFSFDDTVLSIDAIDDTYDSTSKLDGTYSYEENGEQSTITTKGSIEINGNAFTSTIIETCIIGECSVNLDYIAGDTTYRAENVEEDISENNGFNASADFLLPSVGRLHVNYSNIEYCVDGSIDSGTIVISELNSEEQIEIVFTADDECGTYDSNYYETGILL